MDGLGTYSILLLFASITSFNLGMYHLVQSIKRQTRIYMSAGILIFSICLFFALYELTDMPYQYPHLMWINGPLLFTIGPFLYLHTKRNVQWKESLHFIPFIIVFIWILPFYIKTSSEKIEIIGEFYAPTAKPEIEIMQYLYVLHIGLYCLLGYLGLKRRTFLYNSYNSDEIQHRHNTRLQQLYLAISILGVLSFLICFTSDINQVYYRAVDKFTFSLLVILVLVVQVYFAYSGYDEKLEDEFENAQRPKLVKYTPVQLKEFQALRSRVDLLMNTEKMYRKSDLKISEVAEKLGVSSHQLSAAINHQTGNNFFDYINRLRTEELKTTLLDSDNKNYTLFAIAHESGFKSNSSFYRIFRKYVGCTPRQYIQRNGRTP